MKKYVKLFAVLQSLSRSEMSELGRFLPALYSSKKHKSLRLFELLSPEYPNFSDQSPCLRLEQMCQLLDVNESQLNYVVSDLVEMIEDYLSYKVFSETKKYNNVFLLEAYEKRGLTKYLLATLRQLNNDLTAQKMPADKRLLHRYWYAETTAHYTDDSQETEKQAALTQMFDALDNWHNYQLLTASATLLNDQLFKRCDFTFPEKIFSIVAQIGKQAQPNPVLSIYTRIFRLLSLQQELNTYYETHRRQAKLAKLIASQPDEATTMDTNPAIEAVNKQQSEIFTDLLRLIQAQATTQDDPPTLADLREWYQYALNFCYLKTNESRHEYILEIFDLYEILIHKQLLLNEHNEIDSEQYRNIIKINIQLRRFDFAERFLTEYRRYLPENERNDAHQYALALLYFGRGNYDEVLSYLRRLKFSDISYKIDIDTLEIRCYYEKNLDSLLDAKMSAFALFLGKNKKIAPTLQTPYKRFIELVKRLWHMRQELDSLRYREIPRRATPQNIAQLQQDIEQFVGKKSWLYEKTQILSDRLPKKID